MAAIHSWILHWSGACSRQPAKRVRDNWAVHRLLFQSSALTGDGNVVLLKVTDGSETVEMLRVPRTFPECLHQILLHAK